MFFVSQGDVLLVSAESGCTLEQAHTRARAHVVWPIYFARLLQL